MLVECQMNNEQWAVIHLNQYGCPVHYLNTDMFSLHCDLKDMHLNKLFSFLFCLFPSFPCILLSVSWKLISSNITSQCLNYTQWEGIKVFEPIILFAFFLCGIKFSILLKVIINLFFI